MNASPGNFADTIFDTSLPKRSWSMRPTRLPSRISEKRASKRGPLEHVRPLQRAYRASIYWRFEARFTLMRKGSRLGKLMQDRFGKESSKMVSP